MSRRNRKRAAAAALILAIAMLVTRAAGAQDSDSLAIAELMALDQAWIDAEVARDRPALELILDEGFLATLFSGRTIDREAFIEMILEANLEPFEVVHETVRVHGDVAVVIDTSPDGKVKYSWIAMKRDGRWRVISETFSRVQTP